MTAFDIEDAIEQLFTETVVPFRFKKVDISKDILALTQPGITVAVTSGDFTTQGMGDLLDEKNKIIVLLVFKNVASEKERRRIAHPSARYVISKLQGQRLGLEIEPIEALNWREVTSPEHLEQGLLVIEVTLESKIGVTPEIEEREYRALESIWTTYSADDHEAMASQVDFNNGEG